MKETFNHMRFIKQILKFSPRQYKGEIKTADFLENYLRNRKISFFVQKFKTKFPLEEKAILKADNKKISCKSTSFVSGKIPNKENLISSLCKDFQYDDQLGYNINFNPYCPEISCACFYNYPSVAIASKDLGKIINAKKVWGEVKIKPTTYIARNLLVGNKSEPQIICFAHYDSILTGAWDNASSVSVMMGNILKNPSSLEKTLYVFTVNEEVSYDKKPVYWCRGFREFEKTYQRILRKAKKIIVIDGVGISKSKWMDKYENLISTIFFTNLKGLMPKIKRLGASTSEVAQNLYHSKLDKIGVLKEKYLTQTSNLLKKEIIKTK